MIKFTVAGVEIGADFTFFAVVAMFTVLDTTGFAVMSLSVCLIHELGHLFAMFIKGQKPASIVFKGGGAVIATSGAMGKHGNNSVFVIMAGSLVNIILFFSLYFTLPKTNIYPVMFAVLNLVTGVFNLLPIGCLDGKRLAELFMPPKLLKAVEICALCAVFILIAAALFRGGVNFTLAAAAVYIICVDFFSKI